MRDIDTMLEDLHDEYAERVNLAVAEDRDDLVATLSAEFISRSSTPLRDIGPR